MVFRPATAAANRKTHERPIKSRDRRFNSVIVAISAATAHSNASSLTNERLFPPAIPIRLHNRVGIKMAARHRARVRDLRGRLRSKWGVPSDARIKDAAASPAINKYATGTLAPPTTSPLSSPVPTAENQRKRMAIGKTPPRRATGASAIRPSATKVMVGLNTVNNPTAVQAGIESTARMICGLSVEKRREVAKGVFIRRCTRGSTSEDGPSSRGAFLSKPDRLAKDDVLRQDARSVS